MKHKQNVLTKYAIPALLLVVVMGSCKDRNVGVEGLCPEVTMTNPMNLANGVPLNQVVTVTFNTPMDPTTMVSEVFLLTSPTVLPKTGASTAAVQVAGVLTYNSASNSMVFTPSSPLTVSTTYTGTVRTTAKDEMGNALQEPYIWTFTTSSVPSVTSTDPLNLAVNVGLDQVIRATFDQVMNPLSLTASTFTVRVGVTAIAGVVTYSNNVASFTPSAPLALNTEYTATVSIGAMNAAGVPLASNYVWTFRTLSIPTIFSTDPLNLATGVAQNKVVRATFSQAMDPLTITTSSFTLRIGAALVPGATSYTGTTASFTPTNELLADTEYTATITTAAKTTDGAGLVNNYVWTFRTLSIPTIVSTDPLHQATGVARNKVISATFSTAMDPLTITTSSFTLAIGTTSVLGSVNYSSNTASFTPTGGLLSGTVYTATITTQAKNPSGVSLENNHVWTFTTVAPLGPIVVDLKSVGDFGIIAGVGVRNDAGFSEIRNQNVGISPGFRSSITGFPPAIIVNGVMYASDDVAPAGVAALLIQAKQDLLEAYQFAESALFPAPATVSGDIGGTTLAPGIYKSTSTLMVNSGDLTLDAQGDVNAVWIFQVASALTTVGGAGGNIILAGGAQAKNVFWQTGSSATIGDGTIFKGNVLALTSITMNSGATAQGRMLARNGSVVLTSTNIITKP